MADSPSGSSVFDEDRIRRLVELMKEHDLREIDLQEAEQKIRLSRALPEAVHYAPPPMPAHAAPAPQAAAPTPAASAPSAAGVEGPNIVVIKSPMVGTFYARPNPKSESFVKVGDHVEANTTICIIEAMKVFNEIPAEVRGKVVAILAEDEEAVDFGKPLFKVDTSK
jgi:acetyl-CoA carboxylase biotin carboxyl carrier protein